MWGLTIPTAFESGCQASVRTGHLAMIRPISPFTYSWILVFSGLAAYLPDISDA